MERAGDVGGGPSASAIESTACACTALLAVLACRLPWLLGKLILGRLLSRVASGCPGSEPGPSLEEEGPYKALKGLIRPLRAL